MATKTYTTIPTAKQFLRDSSVTFAIRKNDIILTHLDWLLGKLEDTPGKRPVILCDLFLTANFWIKLYHDRNPNLSRERYPVILALFESVVNALASLWGCSPMKVAQTIREIYGRDMHTHGFCVDHGEARAKYFSPMESEQYRLRFKGGLAYQYQWWEDKASHRLVPADSYRCYTAMWRKAENGAKATSTPGYAIFMMDIERNVYMGKANVGDLGSNAGTFHSSFNRGGLVTMAGTIYIVNGKIEAIRADSGHYQPTELNMALFLQALAMYGVKIDTILLFSYDGESRGFALNFLKSKMSWTEFDKQRRKERAHRLNGDDYREMIEMPRKFPDLQRGPAYTRPNQQLQTTVMPPPNVIPGDGGMYFLEE
ncbi:MAG: hypothetical protein JNL62_26940 [Bryobacterales bacterium]|nr:hypothetical protein [Bryobacterales bacterium]